MNQKEIARQMMSFYRTTFDTNYNAIKVLNEQSGKIVDQFWATSTMFPEEGKKAITESLKSYNQGCEDFKKIVDEKFDKIEELF